MAIGEQIKYWRERRGMTQDQLAAAVKCRGEYICRLEKGTPNPTTGKPFNVSSALLEKIADSLKVTLKFEDNEHGQN